MSRLQRWLFGARRLARFLGRRLGVSILDDPHRAAEKMPAIRFDPPAR